MPLYRYWSSIGGDHFYTITRNDAGYACFGYGSRASSATCTRELDFDMKQLAIAAGVIVATAIAFALLPVGDWIAWLVDAIRGTGVLGVALFSVALIAAIVVLVPTVELFVAAGLIYGTVWGALLTTGVSLVGSLLAFTLGRTALRDRVAAIARRHPKLAAVDRAVGDHAFWIATLLQLSPAVPLGPLNYALAATRISLPAFIASYLAGMIPGNVLWAYLGSELRSATQVHQVLVWSSVLATLVTSILVGRVVQRALDRRRH